MTTLTIRGLEANLQELGLKVPIPACPSTQILSDPLDVILSYLVYMLRDLLGRDPEAIYQSILIDGHRSCHGDLWLPLLRFTGDEDVAEGLALDIMRKIEGPAWFTLPIVEGPIVRWFFSTSMTRFLIPYVLDRGRTYGRFPSFGLKSTIKKRILLQCSWLDLARGFDATHARSAALATVLGNMYDNMGWEVTRVSCVRDLSASVARLVARWAEFGNEGTSEDVRHVLRASAKANATAFKAGTGKLTVYEFWAKLRNRDEMTIQLWKSIRSTLFSHLSEQYCRMHVAFDEHIGESQVSTESLSIVSKALEKNSKLERKDGIVSFRLPDNSAAVLVANGVPTMILRAVASIAHRYQQQRFDKVLCVFPQSHASHWYAIETIMDSMADELPGISLMGVLFAHASFGYDGDKVGKPDLAAKILGANHTHETCLGAASILVQSSQSRTKVPIAFKSPKEDEFLPSLQNALVRIEKILVSYQTPRSVGFPLRPHSPTPRVGFCRLADLLIKYPSTLARCFDSLGFQEISWILHEISSLYMIAEEDELPPYSEVEIGVLAATKQTLENGLALLGVHLTPSCCQWKPDGLLFKDWMSQTLPPLQFMKRPDAASSLSPSISTQLTKATESTPHTSITTPSNMLGKRQGIEERERDVLGESSGSTLAAKNDFDVASVISETSTLFAPEKMEDLISRFALAVLSRLTLRTNYSSASQSSRQHAERKLQSALKGFTEEVGLVASTRDQVKATKMVRFSRLRIAQKLQDSTLALVQPSESRREHVEIGVALPEMSFLEKVSGWSMEGSVRGLQDAVSEPIEHTPNAGEDSNRFIPDRPISTAESDDICLSGIDASGHEYGVDVGQIMQELVDGPAFESLVERIESMLELYHGQKMDLIRQKVSLALRRFSDLAKLDPNDPMRAIFRLDWKLSVFVKSNYNDGNLQKLSAILSLTGSADNALMCSVGEYFRIVWPHCHDQLLQALEESLAARDRQFHVDSPSRHVQVDSKLETVTVIGSENLIVSIAQQLAWLVAVFQNKPVATMQAYSSFSQENGSEAGEVPTFEIDVKLERLPKQDSRSCWNSIIEPAVLVAGFPIPKRRSDENGLEVAIPLMAAVADIPQAVSFGGGVVFKGRSHALVPTAEIGSSLQWHLIDVYPKKLEWHEIDRLCPSRLRNQRNLKRSFWSRRSFLGWCPQILELLGTSQYDYQAVQYSSAGKPPRSVRVQKFTVGLSQWGTLTTNVSFGKKDSFRCPRPDDYESHLEDARSLPVIFFDTANRRGFKINAEDLIHHIILHRRQRMSQSQPACDDLEFANPDRRVTSIRRVMMRNAEKVYSVRHQYGSPQPKNVLFKEEVKLLWTAIDGLWAQTYETDEGKSSLEFALDLGQTLTGWEYMDLLNQQRFLNPKATKLRRTCGRWNHLAMDMKALVLFGAEFGNVVSPAAPDKLCPAWASIPRDQCYLSIPVKTLVELFSQQGSLRDQRKLTYSGLSLRCPVGLFGHCPSRAGVGSSRGCGFRHLVGLADQPSSRRDYVCIPFWNYLDGAIVVGAEANFLSHLIPRRSLQHSKDAQGNLEAVDNDQDDPIELGSGAIVSSGTMQVQPLPDFRAKASSDQLPMPA